MEKSLRFLETEDIKPKLAGKKLEGTEDGGLHNNCFKLLRPGREKEK